MSRFIFKVLIGGIGLAIVAASAGWPVVLGAILIYIAM